MTRKLEKEAFVVERMNVSERIKAITEQLEQGIEELFESDKYKSYLNAMSKLHKYSYGNTLLIMMQKPDATMVAGFTKWRDTYKRHVKRGEKGIRILAPAPHKKKKLVQKVNPETKLPVLGADGDPIIEEKEITIPSFRVVSVYDVSQTDGKEIPSIGVDCLNGTIDDYEAFMDVLKQISPVPISFEKIEGGAHGYCSRLEKRIALDEGMSELQTIKTCIHEIAHAKLHLNPWPNGKKPDRSTREVQAESVAYTVCQHFGFDTSDYTFGYVAGWSSGRELTELKASLAVIQETANELIESIEKHRIENSMKNKFLNAI